MMDWTRINSGHHSAGKWHLRYAGKTSWSVESNEGAPARKKHGVRHSFEEAKALAEQLAAEEPT
jgi:hypothetical protein